MSELNSTIQDLPLAGLVPVVLLVVAGLVLWAAGRRVLRVVFASAGLILGFGLGWMFASSWDLGLEPWIPAAILGLAFACTGALVYRVAVAGALAAVLAVAGPAAVVAAGEMQGRQAQPEAMAGTDDLAPEGTDVPLPFGTLEVQDDANDWLLGDVTAEPDDSPDPESRELDPLMQTGLDQLGLGPEAAQRVDEARGYAERLAQAARDWWASTPQELRPAMIGSSILGGLVGLLFGTLAPSLTATIVSAFGGAMLWLGGLRVVLAHLGESAESILPSGTTWLLVLWLITALAGVAIQWTFRPKPADKAG